MKKPTFSKIALLTLLMFLGIQSILIAQNYVPFTPRFDQDLKGDILLIGNNILGPDNNAFNENNVYNHNVDMQYIDIDSDGSTFSSSSADLEIPNPNCYQIIYAGLYWGAVTNGDEPIENVKIKGPSGGYFDVTGEIIYDANGTATGDSYPYSCFADVTSIVTSLDTDLGTYTVANVSSAQGETGDFSPYNGTGFSAGWSLFVVYEDPTLPGKSITSFDGFSAISSSVNLDVPVSGFRTVPAPQPVRANFAFATLEGDKPIQNDRMLLNNVALSAADRPANNFFNSSVTQLSALPVDNRVPNSTNTLGFDTGVMVVPNPGNNVIANDATSAVVRLESDQDVYFQYFFAFAVEIIEPNIVLTKIVEDDSGTDIGGQSVGLGQPLNYVIGFQNVGNDHATNFQIRDVLPINIIFNYPEDLVLPPGVTVASYDPDTREIIFNIDDSLVEINDPVYEIRIEVQTVETCADLADACSNIINNQAFASYQGTINPDFLITDDPSLASNTGCLLSPQATNFLVDLDCTFSEDFVLCGDSITLTAANGYDTYEWSTSPSGTPVIATGQSFTATEIGTYYSINTAPNPCQSIVQQYNVTTFGGDMTNPVIPYADEVVTCPNDGKLLPNIYLCGANDFVDIQTNISGTTSIVWEQLDESSCEAVSNADCANENDACTWNEVETGPDYIADTAGQFRLTINFQGGCYVQFYFNVYENLLEPTVTSTNIICETPGTITVNGVPSGYEYSLDNVNFQSSNVFTVTEPGTYTVYITQTEVETNPCVFTVPNVQIFESEFTASTIVEQPLCFDDFGSIYLAANDVEPQYYFAIHQNGTLVNSVGPQMGNSYTFENLNPGIYTVSFETDDGCEYSEEIEIIQPPLLTVTAALTSPLTCDDGEITIYPEGGTPPYFYFINSATEFQTVPEYTVTAPGTYAIMVMDSNNCSATTTITVDDIPEPDFTVTSTNIECGYTSNGSIIVDVTNAYGTSLEYSIDGGSTFYDSPVFNNLAEGTYEVIVKYTLDGSVCYTDPQQVTITADTTIEGTLELTAPYTCNETGTLTVTNVVGGDAPYSYSIDGTNFQSSNTFTGLTAGTYTVTIQDSSGCSVAVGSMTIDALNPPTDMVFDQTPITCPDNTSTVTITSVTGGTGDLQYQIIAPASAATTYQASNSFPGLAPGTYTFQVMDENECTYSETMTIDPLPTISLNTVLTKNLDCTSNPDAVITGTISGSSAPYTYAVSINGGAFTDLGSTGTTFTYNASTAGTYQFQITDANGCSATSPEHTVNPITPPSISLITQVASILCNGNTNGAIQITIDQSSGTAPFTINVFNNTTGTDYGTQTSSLPAGDYTVTVTDANSCTATDTVVIDEPDPIDVDYHAVDITCTSTGVSQGSIIIDGVTGGTAPYNYFVTGTNGYANSEYNTSGTTSISFDVVDFGLYQINVIDANGCSVLVQDVLVASPPTDLDITVDSNVDCAVGGTAIVSIGSTLASAGPFFFSIYQGPISEYPNPAGSWIPEDAPGSQSATFTGLIPGVSYTFIVYDQSTNCSYYEPATTPIPTNSTLTATALDAHNITCTGNADGTVSFTVNSSYGSAINISYEVFDSLSLVTTGVVGSGSVPGNGTLNVTDLGPLPYGNYYVVITETSGPNAGCGVVSVPFNITQSEIPLALDANIDQNANCHANSGVISAVAHDGTAPYQYQITTTATAPDASDAAWTSNSTFNVDAGSYFVHAIDAYGCVVTVPVDMISDPTPIVDAVATNSCTAVEGAFEIDVTLPTTGVAPYSFSINGGAFQTQSTPFTISNLYSGTHTVEVQDANGCGNLVSVIIEAPLGITPEATVLPSCIDNDGEITVTGTGGSGNFTYAITPSSGSISLSGNVFSGVPAGMYTITITDTDTNCSEEVSISLPAATPPSFTTTPTAVTCYGDDSGAFDINVNGYSGSYTYEVFDINGVSVTGAVAANTSTNPLTVTGMTAGTYTVDIVETESPFCSATSTVIINSPTETLNLIADITSEVTCDNTNGTITATATGGWGNYQYQLTGDATVAWSPNSSFADLGAGSYTVHVIDESGCEATVDVTLTLPDPINADFIASTNMLDCFGDQNASITVENVTGGQESNYTYTLNTILPTPSSSGPQTSNVFSNLGAGTYNITITDGYNCEFASLDIVIDQPTMLNANLVTESTATCLNDAELTLSATGGTPPYAYSATENGAVLGTFTSSVSFAVSPGTHQFYVQDANGCSTGVTNEITIEELPDLIVNLESINPTINCAGDNTGAIVATAQGGLGNYVYTLQDTSGNTINAVQNTPGVFTELLAGTYVVEVESGDCLATTANITITEPQNPLEATFEVNDVTCFGSSDGSIVINATGGTGTIMYAISPQMNQFFQTNTFEDLMPGDYEVIVQDELGCYLTFEFTISEPEPVIISIVPDSMYPEVCAGDQDGEFSIEVFGGTAPYSVSLDSYDGPYTQGASGQTQFDFTGLGGGDHIVYVRDSEGCESEWNITFPEAANIQAVVTIEYLCVNNVSSNTVTVTVNETLTDISQLDYSLNGGPYQMSNVFTDVPPGVGHYIEVRHTNGCTIITDLFEIEGYQPLTLVLMEGEMNQIVAEANGGTGEYEFTFNGENYGQENTYMITETGSYTVTVTDSAGCMAMATLYLEFIDPCIPNYFTPNGDGVADTWGPDCVDNYPELEFSIFDRYGRKIVTLNVGEKWDGKYDGKELPTGDYWYVVNLNSAQVDKDFVGHFTLYR